MPLYALCLEFTQGEPQRESDFPVEGLRKAVRIFAVASLLFCGFLLHLSPDVSQCFPFVHRHMVGLVTLDKVLRFVSRSVVHITLDPYIRNNFLDDDAANPPGF